MENKCDCIIGVLSCGYDNPELATLDKLKNYIAESIYYNETLVPMYAKSDPNRFKRKIWTLKDYGDFRKSTNLSRFKYCPFCGKHIDWGKIRRSEDGK